MLRSTPLPLLASALLSLPLVSHADLGCAGLKSGTYVALNAQDSDPDWKINKLTLDTATKTLTDREGSHRFVKGTEACSFVIKPSNTPFVVAKSGIIVARTTDSNQMVLVLPLQNEPLSKLKGVWNYVLQTRADDKLLHIGNGQIEVKSTGRVNVSNCNAEGSTCSTFTRLGQGSVHPDGGYLLTEPDGSTSRLFSVRGANGQRMMVAVGMPTASGDSQTLVVMGQAQTVSTPAVNTSYAQWDITQSPAGVVSALGSSSLTVTAADSTAGTFTRVRASDCRVENWQVNHGRTGMAYRNRTSYTDCATHTTKTTNKNLSLGLSQNFGFNAFGWESTVSSEARYFGFAVRKP